MNIAFGRIGKKLFFNPNNWGLIGGNAAPIILITNLAAMHPQNQYYIIGRSDWNTLDEDFKNEICPNGNITNVLRDRDRLPKVEEMLKGECDLHEQPIKYFKKNNIKIHAGIFINGILCHAYQFNKTYKVNKKDHIRILPMFYLDGSSIVNTLNNLQFPFVAITQDPRQVGINENREYFNTKFTTLTQQNFGTIQFKHIKSYKQAKEVITDPIDFIYGHTQKTFLMGQKKPNKKDYINNRNTLISIFMNGHGSNYKKDGRYDVINEYIFSNFPNTLVYGKWSNQIVEKDPRFIVKRMGNMKDIVYDTKYTLVNSIKPGFVTCKPWQMIHFGIIPFFTPDYDPQNLLGLPDFLHLKDPQDLKKKIEMLQSNPEYYDELRQFLYKHLKDQYYDGTFFDSVINHHINKFIPQNEPKLQSAKLKASIKVSSFIENNKNK